MHAWCEVKAVHVFRACSPVKWVVRAVWQGSLAGSCRAELLCNVTQVARVRSGVRALPQKTVHGAIPLAGKLPSSGNIHK